MELKMMFFTNSIMLGVGLAMDAFSVSMADGLNEPCMCKRKMFFIAFLFAFFQALMPMIGWVCVHTVMQHFKAFEKFIPYIALILLVFVGVKMLKEGKECSCESECCDSRGILIGTLLLQGVATSIDALSVGFTIASYSFEMALLCVAIIAFVTFFICLAGLIIGRKFGMKIAGKAQILGGIILILIGIEIFLSGILK